MFPMHQRGPMRPYRSTPTRRSFRNPTRSNVFAMFQDTEGNVDFERLTLTARQINEIYTQINPIISQFRRR
ncbi:YppG family protein [Ornithinibacillus halophilus]|uniref:YppG-like protein n=1 Tax=Ornithinibacillus halophilus TaxID=930117 RepID=A0A1M5FKW1_9BACI|nr:YppG family protein [Ornithinibacillus halophilus]SHF92074.1 YppG-like protein [Ornithinibacillus halophilus]